MYKSDLAAHICSLSSKMGGGDRRIPISSQASQAPAAQATDRPCLRQDGRSDLSFEVVVYPPHAWHAPCSHVRLNILSPPG